MQAYLEVEYESTQRHVPSSEDCVSDEQQQPPFQELLLLIQGKVSADELRTSAEEFAMRIIEGAYSKPLGLGHDIPLLLKFCKGQG